MNKLILLSLTIIMICCSSCLTLWPKKSTEPIDEMRKNITIAQERIDTSQTTLKKSTDEIKDSATNIQKNTEEIENKMPSNTAVEIKEKISEIEKNAGSIIKETDNLINVSSNLASIKKNLSQVENSSQKAVEDTAILIEKIKQLEDEKQNALKKAMNYLIVIAILLIAISAVGVFQGNYKAIGGIIGGVIIIVSSLAVSVLYTKLAWIGLIGIIGVVLIVGFGIYQGISHKKQRKEDEKAIEETVLTTEALKDKLPEDVRKEFFGDKAYPGRVKNIQSKETEEKVLNARRKLKNIIDPVIPGN